MLSQKTRYALKALLELALARRGVTLSSAAISARRNIPVKFLEAILVELKRDGLVHGRRGRGGGYQLAQNPEAISFGTVVRLMEGPLALLPCVSVSQFKRCVDCSSDRACELKKLFREVRDGTASILDGWSLADALGRRRRPDVALSPVPRKSSRRRSSTTRTIRRKAVEK